MRFIFGAPSFAAEVRSVNDYGPAAEAELAEKRSDYFQAGTEVVCDVDMIAECIPVYRASDPDHPVTYRRGDLAEAEPGVPGWSVGERGKGDIHCAKKLGEGESDVNIIRFPAGIGGRIRHACG